MKKLMVPVIHYVSSISFLILLNKFFVIQLKPVPLFSDQSPHIQLQKEKIRILYE